MHEESLPSKDVLSTNKREDSEKVLKVRRIHLQFRKERCE